MKHTTNKPMNRTLAHALKHLMTSVPMAVGFLVALGSVGSYELDLIAMPQFCIQTVLGIALCALGTIILNWFEN